MTTLESRPPSPEDLADNDQKPCGHGRMLRKEDPRFIRGRGNYVDDVSLRGMLHLAILRSPYAHARINSIDVSAAQAHPKVKAVVTGADLAEKGLAWMPTLSNDVQAVLATDKVRFQGQEVAFVVAEDRYSARDALELIDVDYEALTPVVDARKALDADAEVIRTDLEGKADNHCFDWETGDAAATEAVFAKADVVVKQEIVYPRVHPAPMETCGAVADLDPVTGKLTLWSTTQAPHAHRTLYALVAGLPEHKIRVISPDIGGGFGNKVPIYPGYVCAIVGSLLLGKPVKWMEDRSENLTSTGFARDYIMVGEIAATSDGKILAIRSNVLADHGAFNGTAAPVKYPAGFFGVFTGSYDIEAAYCHMTAVYTNKAPGGVAYACSFRITEAVYFVERLVDCLAYELKMDPAQLRLQNLLKPDQFPYKSKTGWVYDSGDYETTMRKAMEMIGYDALRAEQKERRERGELMGIGMSFFTEAVGAGPRKDMDILGLGMADGCELRVHPTGKAVVRLSVQTQGQGHETTFAQIVAEELGIPPDDIDVVHGDTDQTPFGLGTYGSRSTPVSGAAAALVARKVRDKARIIASGMLEASIADLEWEKGSLPRQGRPEASVTIAGHRDARPRRRRPARGDRGRSGRRGLLQPGESHVSVRGVLLCRGHRSGHRRGEGTAFPGRRRLRHPHQSDDHRGSGARWYHRRYRHGADGDHRVRRGRELPRWLADGLPHPHRRGGAALRDRPHGDAVTAPPDRSEGDRRIRHRRIATGRRECGRRRVGAVRRAARRHAADSVAGVGGHAGPGHPADLEGTYEDSDKDGRTGAAAAADADTVRPRHCCARGTTDLGASW